MRVEKTCFKNGSFFLHIYKLNLLFLGITVIITIHRYQHKLIKDEE
jgi:hypothetical protein